MRNYIFFVLLLFFTSSCVKYSPYVTNLSSDEYDNNQRNLDDILKIPEKDTLCFMLTGDVQRFYDETNAMVAHANTDPEFDFMIFTGDMTDFGVRDEFKTMHHILNKLDFPFLCSVGNHDFNYNGGAIYLEMFGPYDYSFTLQGFKFVFINTNGREFEWSTNVPDIDWLESELADTSSYNGAIVVNHVAPWNVDFTPSLEEPFANALHYAGKTMMELNGHNHDYTSSYPYFEDIQYINTSSPLHRMYIKIKIWKTDNYSADYSMERVEF